MKKVIFILCVSFVVLNCKSDSKSAEKAIEINKEKDTLITLTGDFIYYADAAVLQTNNEIYGVIINAKMHELDEAVKPLKNEATDMVSVTVKANKFEKPANEEGWPYRIEIKEILKVEKPKSDKQDVIILDHVKDK